MATKLHPIVYWAQTEDNISLKVDLRDTSDPEIDVTAEGLYFKACGYGAGGLNEYEFEINFHKKVNPDKSAYRVMDRAVEFNLTKDGPALFWPRLIKEDPKPAWLRIDFDKWKSEDESEEEDEEELAKRDQDNQMREIERTLLETKEKDMEPAYSDVKTSYLFLFNLLQFIGFTYSTLYLLSRYIFHGKENMKYAYDRAVIPIGVCQTFAFLEILHPMIGIVKTGVMAPFMQVMGRNLILFLVVAPNPEVQSEPMVCYLFLVWSAVEVFRYPFYMLGVIDYNSEVVTWLRYTVWIPLYPLGFISEILVIYLSIPYYETSEKFSIFLPNGYNMSFYFPYWLYTHMAIILLFAPYMMSHMWRQRQRRFAPKRRRNLHFTIGDRPGKVKSN